jgi:aminoglycoside phosphotransferase family enzyme
LNKLAQKYFANSPVMQRIKNARDQFLEKQMQIFDRRKTQEQIYHEQQENLKLFQKISMSEQEARLK